MRPSEGRNKAAATSAAAKPTFAAAAKPTTMTTAVKSEPAKATREAAGSVAKWTQCGGKGYIGALIDSEALCQGQLALSKSWTSKTPKGKVAKEIKATLQGQEPHPSNLNKHADMLADLAIFAQDVSLFSPEVRRFFGNVRSAIDGLHGGRVQPKVLAEGRRLDFDTVQQYHGILMMSHQVRRLPINLDEKPEGMTSKVSRSTNCFSSTAAQAAAVTAMSQLTQALGTDLLPKTAGQKSNADEPHPIRGFIDHQAVQEAQIATVNSWKDQLAWYLQTPRRYVDTVRGICASFKTTATGLNDRMQAWAVQKLDNRAEWLAEVAVQHGV